MTWTATAPSNIALIKYMGKADFGQNIPLNASLSYTLPHLSSKVVIDVAEAEDAWAPLDTNLVLPEPAQARFLKHLRFIKQQLNCDTPLLVRSTNNFPQGTGLASSASSFAALTRAACMAVSDLTNTALPDISIQANLSRLGSGSSCRSFFEPWALWQESNVSHIELPYQDLIHQAVLIDTTPKEVSSSEAHKKVSTLADFSHRIQRAEGNLKALLTALRNENWFDAYGVSYQEFEDMHNLFAQAKPPFSYINSKSKEALSLLTGVWKAYDDGPIITMDAGPNIHLLYRSSQIEQADMIKNELMERGFNVI